MRHVYLPTEHSETDLVLAGHIAELLESSTLYVTWSPSGYGEPRIEAVVRRAPAAAPTAPDAQRPGVLGDVLATMSAFLGAIFKPRRAAREGDGPIG